MSGPDLDRAAGRELARAGVWNLSLNVLSKAQGAGLLIAGSMIDGLAGAGVAVTAMAACYLGAGLADFGLALEMGRMSVTHPTREMVRRCLRALAAQIPLALVIAPVAQYATIGHRTGSSAALLAAVSVGAAFLMATIALTSVLNGLGDFRSPATALGPMRVIGALAAIVGAAIHPDPAVILGAFAVSEGLGCLLLARALARRTRDLPSTDGAHVRVHRSHLWLGGAGVLNVLTNQSDTLLVASILTPDEVGLFGIASLVRNGAGTLAQATATPYAVRAVRTRVEGGSPRRLINQGVMVAGGLAAAIGLVGWLAIQGAASALDSVSQLGGDTSEVVFGLVLLASVPFAMAAVLIAVAVGYGMHRSVGVVMITTGLVAAVCIASAAELFGIVGAAGATVIRDSLLLVLALNLIRTAPGARGA